MTTRTASNRIASATARAAKARQLGFTLQELSTPVKDSTAEPPLTNGVAAPAAEATANAV